MVNPIVLRVGDGIKLHNEKC